jgi:two-component system chemotaxis response regulator CheY
MGENVTQPAILLVDDLVNARNIICRLLSSIGYTNVVEADSGADALQTAKERKFNLVITDFNLRDMTGLELLEKLRGLGLRPGCIVVTGEQDDAVLRRIEAEKILLLRKPFGSEALRSKIDMLLPL